jgi:hypothetical protein
LSPGDRTTSTRSRWVRACRARCANRSVDPRMHAFIAVPSFRTSRHAYREVCLLERCSKLNSQNRSRKPQQNDAFRTDASGNRWNPFGTIGIQTLRRKK